MTRNQNDPCTIETESGRTIVNCGRSIIEGSRLSDIDQAATNFVQTNEAKTAILQTRRVAEFTALQIPSGINLC